MQRKVFLLSAPALAFLLLGGAWVSLLRWLPDGTPRRVAVVLLGVAVVAVYVGLLVSHIRKLLKGEGRAWLEATLAMGELVLLLLGFAAIHQGLGIMDNTRPGAPVVHDFWTSAYLSVMTFTTVGYGDFYPTGVGRALAALQGLTGYVVLGVLASTVWSLLSPFSPTGLDRQEEERRATARKDRAGAEGERSETVAEAGPERALRSADPDRPG